MQSMRIHEKLWRERMPWIEGLQLSSNAYRRSYFTMSCATS